MPEQRKRKATAQEKTEAIRQRLKQVCDLLESVLMMVDDEHLTQDAQCLVDALEPAKQNIADAAEYYTGFVFHK